MIMSYQDLEVWQKAMDLVVDCYQITKTFPRCEIYGLSSQLQRAATSIPSNIAEGQKRRHTQEFLQFLSISRGSLAELETQLLIGNKLNYLDDDRLSKLLVKTDYLGRLISRLISSLKNKETYR